MKANLKLTAYFFLCFLLSSSILYFTVAAWREESLRMSLASHRPLSEEERNQQVEKIENMEREKLKTFTSDSPFNSIFLDPLMIDYVSKTYGTSLRYQIHFFYDVVPAIEGRKQTSLSCMMLFESYGRLYSYENLQLVGLQGFSAPNVGPSPYFDDYIFNRMASAIATWEAEGNKREGDWLDKFMQSPHYEAFLGEMCGEIDVLPHGESVESTVMAIRGLRIENSRNPLEILKNRFLRDAQELAEIEFQAYQQHKLEEDCVLACIDAEIVYFIWQRVQFAEKLTPLHYDDLHWSNSFFPNPFVDLAGIFLGALIVSTVVVVMCRRRIESD